MRPDPPRLHLRLGRMQPLSVGRHHLTLDCPTGTGAPLVTVTGKPKVALSDGGVQVSCTKTAEGYLFQNQNTNKMSYWKGG